VVYPNYYAGDGLLELRKPTRKPLTSSVADLLYNVIDFTNRSV